MNRKFSITDGKGFFLPLPNGYGVSVQFGYGNYADNYDDRFGIEDYRERNRMSGKEGSSTAECAVVSPAGNLIDLPEKFGDTVTNRSSPAEVLELIQWAAELKP